MPRRRPRAFDQIEQDFFDAIGRIESGRPQNATLRAKLRAGKEVHLNISNVALEAGRSRGLIAMENCRYPKVRQTVLLKASLPEEPSSRDDVIARLRAELVEERTKSAEVMSQAAYHFDRYNKVSAELDQLKAKHKKLSAKHQLLERRFAVVSAREDGKVVTLHWPLDEGEDDDAQ